MTWVRLEDTFPEHPKVIGLSDRAFRMFLVGLCYSNRNLTDGVLSVAAQRHMRATKAIATELVRAGLWELGKLGAFVVHDYLHYQFSKEDVIAARRSQSLAGKARAATAMRVGGRFAPAPHQPAAGEPSPAEHQPIPYPSRTHVSIETGTPRRAGLRAIGGAVRALEEAVRDS